MWGLIDDYGCGWGGVGVGMLLFWGILIDVILMLVRYTYGSGGHAGRERKKSALDLLNERYARSEIERRNSSKKSAIWKAEEGATIIP